MCELVLVSPSIMMISNGMSNKSLNPYLTWKLVQQSNLFRIGNEQLFPVVSNNLLAVSNYNGVPFTLRFCATAKKSDDSDCSQFSISWFSTKIECEKNYRLLCRNCFLSCHRSSSFKRLQYSDNIPRNAICYYLKWSANELKTNLIYSWYLKWRPISVFIS